MTALPYLLYFLVCFSSLQSNPTSTAPPPRLSYELDEQSTQFQQVELGSRVTLRCHHSITHWTRLAFLMLASNTVEIVLTNTWNSKKNPTTGSLQICQGSLRRSDGECREDVEYDAIDGRYIRFLSIKMSDAGMYTCHSVDFSSFSITVRVINRGPPLEDELNRVTHQTEGHSGSGIKWLGSLVIGIVVFLLFAAFSVFCVCGCQCFATAFECLICRFPSFLIRRMRNSVPRRCRTNNEDNPVAHFTLNSSPLSVEERLEGRYLITTRRHNEVTNGELPPSTAELAAMIDAPPTYEEVMAETQPPAFSSEMPLERSNDEMPPHYAASTRQTLN